MTLAQLLVVQEHDSTIDRLTHRRAHLPEQQALVDCDEEQAHLNETREPVAERRHELTRSQKRLEDDVALIVARRDKDNERLYSGSVTAHKDLKAIQDELAVLATRQEGIEDEVLEVMEAAEPVDAELADIDAKLASVAERRAVLEQQLAEAQLAIDVEMESEAAARTAALVGVDAELVAEYEQRRENLGGVAIAVLNGKTCEGCHLQLPAVHYDRIRKEPADAMVYCNECERILVRS